MAEVDLNLLVALDALLTECSVTAAARRLGLSPSAMSRTLARLRRVTGDPLLVQAGRGMVPTPYAEALAGRVQSAAEEARAVLRPPAAGLDPAVLHQDFTLRAGEGFVELLAAPLVARIAEVAPHVRLRFVPKPDWDVRPLREGRIDLEIGVIGTEAPEVRSQLAFRDHYVGVVRRGHPLLAGGSVTVAAYAACAHVAASREGRFADAADPALAALGQGRRVALAVPTYPEAMRVARASDLVALVPHSCLGNRLVPDHARLMGLESFALPFATPEFAICAIWHPRLDADPAHRWLRGMVLALGKAAYG
ncbi:LysR family transcriptional regulator [Thioclava sp. BHET1]|nr:LysR family transcriptional regulator [Thioclava sp. BHET1]